MAENAIALESLYEVLGYTFKNPSLLKQALTHASIRPGHAGINYERLEFLGDRVLSLVIAQFIFERFPKDREGSLARRHTYLVRRERLVDVAKGLKLEPYIYMAKHEASANERTKASVIADVCEAIIGALYLDGGIEVADQFIRKYWEPFLNVPSTSLKDAKSSLQEWAQARGLAPPIYKLSKRTGADHSPTFIMEVHIEGYPREQGRGSSKQEASQAAAQNFINLIKERSHE